MTDDVDDVGAAQEAGTEAWAGGTAAACSPSLLPPLLPPLVAAAVDDDDEGSCQPAPRPPHCSVCARCTAAARVRFSSFSSSNRSDATSSVVVATAAAAELLTIRVVAASANEGVVADAEASAIVLNRVACTARISSRFDA